MAVATTLRSVLPSLDGSRNLVRDSWDRLHGYPGGTWLFSRLIGRMAPYTGTIGAHVVELQPGFSRVQMRDKPGLRNHLRCVHAIALANLAELTGNVAMAYSMPDDARFIVAGMDIEYVKKARGTITGECRCEIATTSARKEYEVPVSLMNDAGEVVCTASLRTLIGPKPGA